MNDSVDTLMELYYYMSDPKKMKLSELIDKLNGSNDSAEWKVIIRCQSTVLENSHYPGQYIYIFDNNKIEDISEMVFSEEYKWLYGLWIAGTIIEDDMKEVE